MALLHWLRNLAVLAALTRQAACMPGSLSPRQNLPACSSVYQPCACPDGATFKNLTTYGLIGAPTVDVQPIIGSFLNSEYQGGLTPINTTGEDFTAGATRTFNLSGPTGYYLYTEQLVSYTTYADGSFVQVNEQAPSNPTVQIPGGGTYYGQWSIITGQQTRIPNETAVSWQNWRCESGDTFDAAQSHEDGIANATAILHGTGMDTGVDIAPYTFWFAGGPNATSCSS